MRKNLQRSKFNPHSIFSWNEDGKKIWEGKTWQEGVSKQAVHYKGKTDDHIISLIEKESDTKLSDNEKKQLLAASAAAQQHFQDELAQLKQENAENPMSPVLLQLRYAQLMQNMAKDVNKTIDELNKQRKDNNQPPITKLETSVKKYTDFANNIKVTDDVKAINENMKNHIAIEKLDNQQKALRQTAAKALQDPAQVAPTSPQKQTSAAQIKHVELSTSASYYDPDASTYYARQPTINNSQVIMAQACLAINRELGAQKITMQKTTDGNIKFEYNNENFYFDPRQKTFFGENMSKETFEMMTKVYNKTYGDSNKEIVYDDLTSKNICQEVLEKDSKSKVTYTSNPEKLAKQSAELEVDKSKAETATATIQPSTRNTLKPS